MNRLIAIATGVTLSLLLAGPVSGHLGAESFILVPAEQVLPGTQFSVIASDVAPDATISFELRGDDYSASLGSAIAGADGHFETALTMPPDAPTGYSELIASSADGTSVSTWILVGSRTASAGPLPSTSSGGGIDPSVIVLGVLLGGAAGGIGYLLLRPRRKLAPVVDSSADHDRIRRKSGRRAKNR